MRMRFTVGAYQMCIRDSEETGLTGAFALKEGFMSGDILLNLDSEDEGEIFIGCAGGIDSVAEFTYKDIEVPAGYFFFKVEVKGCLLYTSHSRTGWRRADDDCIVNEKHTPSR